MMIALTSVLLLVTLVSARPEPPVDQYLPPSNQQYGPPSRDPSDFNIGQSGSNQYLPPNQQYGPPNGPQNSGYDDGSNNGPAKYDFEYSVNDPDSGNDFGHKESRDGDVTIGKYYVLLPSGKRQTVEYIADANGYRPTITYEDAGGNNGYPSGNNGYLY